MLLLPNIMKPKTRNPNGTAVQAMVSTQSVQHNHSNKHRNASGAMVSTQSVQTNTIGHSNKQEARSGPCSTHLPCLRSKKLNIFFNKNVRYGRLYYSAGGGGKQGKPPPPDPLHLHTVGSLSDHLFMVHK